MYNSTNFCSVREFLFISKNRKTPLSPPPEPHKNDQFRGKIEIKFFARFTLYEKWKNSRHIWLTYIISIHTQWYINEWQRYIYNICIIHTKSSSKNEYVCMDESIINALLIWKFNAHTHTHTHTSNNSFCWRWLINRLITQRTGKKSTCLPLLKKKKHGEKINTKSVQRKINRI